MSEFDLRGARVVVTGAGSGIGAATALCFAQRGSEVIAVDIDGASAETTASRCGGSAYVCDVADSDAVLALAATIEQDSGPVDVLVNNAGVGVAGSLLETGIDDWDWLRSINLDGVAYGCYAFGPAMIARRRGHVVNVSSSAAFMPNRSMAAYCAAKAGVYSFSHCLRADWAASGVGVSVICPGVINTPIPNHARVFGAVAEHRDRFTRIFSRGHPPELVGKAIVRAVERNRAVVPVGIEASVVYHLLRVAPARVQGFVAKAQVR